MELTVHMVKVIKIENDNLVPMLGDEFRYLSELIRRIRRCDLVDSTDQSDKTRFK